VSRFSHTANRLILYYVFRIIKKIIGTEHISTPYKKFIASIVLCVFWHIPFKCFNSQIRSLYYLINGSYSSALREELKWFATNDLNKILDAFLENLERNRLVHDANVRNVYVIAPAIEKEVGLRLLNGATDQDAFVMIYQPENELVEYAMTLSKKNKLKVYLFTNIGYRRTLDKTLSNEVRCISKYDVIEQSEVKFPQFLLNGELLTGVWSLLFAVSVFGRMGDNNRIHACGFDMYSREEVYSSTLSARKVIDNLDKESRRLSLALHSPFKNFQIICALRDYHGLLFDQVATQLIADGLESYSRKLDGTRNK